VDLRGVCAMPAGPVAAGRRVTRIGPFLEVPRVTLPKAGQELGKTLAWTSRPGLAADYHIVRLVDASWQNKWLMVVKGDVQKVQLPDLTLLAGISPFQPGPKRARLWRIWQPGFDIDNYTSKGISLWNWSSWAYAEHTTGDVAPPPKLVDDKAAVGPKPQGDSSGASGAFQPKFPPP